MKKFLFLFVLLLSAGVNAQNFPDGWVGDYSGEMHIGFAEKQGDTVDVDFEIHEVAKDSAWTYKMTYHSDKFGEIVKDYVIRKRGETASDFILDELDGILIEMTLMDNCFYSSFEVLGSIYTATIYKYGEDFFFDLIVVSLKPSMESKSEEDDEGNSFEVNSYKPTLHQSVSLKRQ